MVPPDYCSRKDDYPRNRNPWSSLPLAWPVPVYLPPTFFLSNHFHKKWTPLEDSGNHAQVKNLCLSFAFCNPLGSVALHRMESAENFQLLESVQFAQGSKHVESLVPSLQNIFQSTRTSLSNVCQLLSSRGPGSFTGLRAAFASLKAISIAHELPLLTLHSAEARALIYFSHYEPFKQIKVVSTLSQNKFVVSTFHSAEKSLLAKEESLETATSLKEKYALEPELFLFDLRAMNVLQIRKKNYDLLASDMPTTLQHSRTLTSCSGIQNLSKLSPIYIGDHLKTVR